MSMLSHFSPLGWSSPDGGRSKTNTASHSVLSSPRKNLVGITLVKCHSYIGYGLLCNNYIGHWGFQGIRLGIIKVQGHR